MLVIESSSYLNQLDFSVTHASQSNMLWLALHAHFSASYPRNPHFILDRYSESLFPPTLPVWSNRVFLLVLQCGPVVRGLALRSENPGFTTSSDHLLNLIMVVPGYLGISVDGANLTVPHWSDTGVALAEMRNGGISTTSSCWPLAYVHAAHGTVLPASWH